MTLARVDNTPCKKTGEFSLDLSEMRPVNVVTLLMCHLKRPLRYGGYLFNQIQQNNVEIYVLSLKGQCSPMCRRRKLFRALCSRVI